MSSHRVEGGKVANERDGLGAVGLAVLAGSAVLGVEPAPELSIDPRERLDPAVEDVLLEVADDFVESVTAFACQLAKHRRSTVLEAKDVLLHLERNWHISIPGLGGDEVRPYKRPQPADEAHRQRQALVRRSQKASQAASTPAAGTADGLPQSPRPVLAKSAALAAATSTNPSSSTGPHGAPQPVL
eukprot:SM000138S00026  [mRNA]  locus=s138:1296:4125:- [translate_table: standard]